MAILGILLLMGYFASGILFPIQAQVDPNLASRLSQGPIIVDHTSIPLFDQIPDVYIQRAQNIRMMWGDRSVGGNISDGLDCLSYESDEVAPSRCRGYNHNYPQFASPQSWVNWFRTGGYSRSNWIFHFDPGFGITPELSCVSNNGMWDGLVNCFIEHVRGNANAYDVFGYQHSYLVIQPGSSIASPTNGYFVNQSNRIDISDYERLETDFPSKVFFYWTTSLARGLGSQEGTEYNNQMRNFARSRNKILLDVADIESHAPDGSACYDNRDGVQYCTSPTSTNCENFPDDGVNYPAICQHYTTETNGGHLYDPAKMILAKMYWVMMAQIAGWTPGGASGTPRPTATVMPSATPRPSTAASPTATSAPTPTPTPAPRPADVDRDGDVDIVDHDLVVSSFFWQGPPGERREDVNRDGEVDVWDITLVVEQFGV